MTHHIKPQMLPGAPAPDGEPGRVYSLVNDAGMEVQLLDLGATWLGCKVPVSGKLREVILGVDCMDDYLAQAACRGATIGRYANRIAEGKCLIDGERVQLHANEGPHCLHGGPEGFHRRRWLVKYASARELTFALTSPHGDQDDPV